MPLSVQGQHEKKQTSQQQCCDFRNLKWTMVQGSIQDSILIPDDNLSHSRFLLKHMSSTLTALRLHCLHNQNATKMTSLSPTEHNICSSYSENKILCLVFKGHMPKVGLTHSCLTGEDSMIKSLKNFHREFATIKWINGCHIII